MKQVVIAAAALIALSSCGKINRIMDGTENLPNQINETNMGMAKTNEAIRKQKIGEAFKIMLDDNNRKVLAPIPSNMMSAAKTMAEALTADEAVLFVKNYLIKINEEAFGDNDYSTELGLEKFEQGKRADLSMITLISGFLPQETVKEIITTQSEQGAYREIAFAILKMRATFNSDTMLQAGLIGGDKKLVTLGQIQKAIEYNEKVEFICNLDFVEQIAMKITGFTEESDNKKYSKALDKDLALNNWKQIQKKATEDFKAQSFSKDPAQNEANIKEYAAKYKETLALIQKRIDSYSK